MSWFFKKKEEEEILKRILLEQRDEMKSITSRLNSLKEELDTVRIIALESRKKYLEKLTKLTREEESSKEEEKKDPMQSIFIAER